MRTKDEGQSCSQGRSGEYKPHTQLKVQKGNPRRFQNKLPFSVPAPVVLKRKISIVRAQVRPGLTAVPAAKSLELYPGLILVQAKQHWRAPESGHTEFRGKFRAI